MSMAEGDLRAHPLSLLEAAAGVIPKPEPTRHTPPTSMTMPTLLTHACLMMFSCVVR